MINAVIIDDEINGRELLQEMLANYIQGIRVQGTGKDVKSGIDIIRKTKPDLVFLDIEMPGGNGFSVLDAFENIDFKVIFITGFVEYAIKAIKYSALDYILKPIDLQELKEAIDKVAAQNFNITPNFKLLKSYTDFPDNNPQTIVISGVKMQHFIPTDKIQAIVINNGNTVVIPHKDPQIITLSSLIHFEGILPASQFMRIHKSALVNLNVILKIDHGRSGDVHLKNGMTLPFSSRKKSELVKRLKDAQNS